MHTSSSHHLYCLVDSRGSKEGQGLFGVCRGFCPGAKKPCRYVETHFLLDVKIKEKLLFSLVDILNSLCVFVKA